MTDMTVTNQTTNDYWFGPLHLPAGIGQTLVVDVTSNVSLYLTDDAVADALNNLYNSNRITVTNPPSPFPRATGVPQILHGDGSPDGRVFAPQGSAYMRRDNTGATSSLYVKTTGISFSTGWQAISTAQIAVPTGLIQMWAGASAPSSDWLICDGTAVSRTVYSALFAVTGTVYGAGDGSTTFNVPDLRGRVPAGFAASGGHPDVGTLGNNEGTALASRRPRHPHTNGLSAGNNLTLPNHGHAISDSGHAHLTRMFQNPGADPSGYSAPVGLPSPNQGSTEFTTGSPFQGENSATTGISVGNPTSNPAINGSVSLSGTIGAAGTANDAPAYIVVNFIIKT
jgi:microcystin-dependent protein